MERVFKYELRPDEPDIWLPVGAEVLSVGFQGETLCMWAKVDDTKETKPRYFYVYGTGHEIPHAGENSHTKYLFIGTAFMNGLVFHAFEAVAITP